jgi:hypothetical protein
VRIDVAGLKELLERIKPQVCAGDHAYIASLASTLVEVSQLAREQGATIARLRHFLGQTSSEKTKTVLGKPASNAPPPAGPTGQTEGTAPAADAPPAKDAPDGGPTPTPEGDDKPRAKGHGRLGAKAYGGDPIRVPHEQMRAGQECPHCAHGKLYGLREQAWTVRVFGRVPLVAVTWACDRLRCGGCGGVFTAPLPEQARGPKYDATAASTMIVLRYGAGMPLHRLDGLQRRFGTPVPASTQWDVANDRLDDVLPAFHELARRGADGDIVHSDDTFIRILELMGKRREKLLAPGLDLPDRTGLFTTGIVALTPDGPIALFASGRQHAGENLADLLDARDERLPTPIQMCDGLDRNLPDQHPVLEANCLAHGRRHFVDEAASFPDLVRHVLEEIGKVFANDRVCRAEGLDGTARLERHQAQSGPVMNGLRAWMRDHLDNKTVEPNSGLGDAFAYLLKRWDKLTLFLRVRDAPIDSRVGGRRGGVRYGESLLPAAFALRRCLSPSMAPFPAPATSNRTGGFPASGSPRGCHRIGFMCPSRRVPLSRDGRIAPGSHCRAPRCRTRSRYSTSPSRDLCASASSPRIASP